MRFDLLHYYTDDSTSAYTVMHPPPTLAQMLRPQPTSIGIGRGLRKCSLPRREAWLTRTKRDEINFESFLGQLAAGIDNVQYKHKHRLIYIIYIVSAVLQKRESKKDVDTEHMWVILHETEKMDLLINKNVTHDTTWVMNTWEKKETNNENDRHDSKCPQDRTEKKKKEKLHWSVWRLV